MVTFSLSRYGRVRGALLTPDGTGPFPAVLLLHDHGAKFDIGKEKLVRPWYDDTRLTSAQAWADRYFSGRFVGDELARRGYVVLAVDALGWGDRGPVTYEEQQALASNLYNLGSSLAGLMAREDVRAAAFLAGLDRVDRRRVAALGFSMGAFRAWQTAALSDDIAAAASVCWMTGLKEMMVPGNNILRGQSSYYMLHPGLARHLDFPDVASIGAPKPMLFFNGGLDPLFPADGVRVAHDKLRAVWRSRHAEERLQAEDLAGPRPCVHRTHAGRGLRMARLRPVKHPTRTRKEPLSMSRRTTLALGTALALGAGLAVLPTQAYAATVVVSNSTDLSNAIKNATAGTVIQVRGGTYYPTATLQSTATAPPPAGYPSSRTARRP